MIYLRLYDKLCMQTLLSTDIDTTAASVSLEIGGPSLLSNGKNSKPVTNIECAAGMCKTRCKLNAMYIDTEPLNIVPTATKRPSSLTANDARLSSMATEFDIAPFSGFHSCKYPV